MLALPHGAADNRVDRALAAGLHERMPGQVRRQVRRDADRPHARAAAAVRDRERLVQVEMADVGANRGRTRQTRPARSCWRRPCTPVRRARARCAQMSRISSSNTPCVEGYVIIRHGEAVAVLGRLRAQVVDVDVAVRRRGDDDDAHAGHRGARRIRAVRRRRDEHDVAVRLAAVAVIRADHHQARELTLRAGVRLQRHGGEAR